MLRSSCLLRGKYAILSNIGPAICWSARRTRNPAGKGKAISRDPLEQKIEFIIEHHAQFSAEMLELKQQMSQLTGNVNRIANTVDRLTADAVTFRDSILNLRDVVLSLANIVEGHGEQIADLIEQDRKHSERSRQNDEQIAALIEQGKESRELLNALLRQAQNGDERSKN